MESRLYGLIGQDFERVSIFKLSRILSKSVVKEMKMIVSASTYLMCLLVDDCSSNSF